MDKDIQREIRKIIDRIEKKSADGDYIYRGEPETHEGSPYYGKVSSSLWREYGIEIRGFDIEIVQEEMLSQAKKHTGHPQHDLVADFANMFPRYGSETADFELLAEIQHYGGKTNLIDFTTDYLIALFFACDGHHDKPGRVILQKIEDINDMIMQPRNPRHRIIAQKSIFVHPPKGFMEPHEDDVVTILPNLKQPLLEHLRKYHAVFAETIYNDIYGFIRTQNIHRSAYTEFYIGFNHQDKGRKATDPEEKQKEYQESIEHYDKAIELNAEFKQAYCNRGEALLHLRKWEKAEADLITAKEMGLDIIASFRNDYTDVEEFKNINGFELPEDIAEMLTPKQS